MTLLRPIQLREFVETNDIYKMSLGKAALYEQEAFNRNALIFQSEIKLHDAVMSGSSIEIEKAAAKTRSENYRDGDPPREAWSIWVKNIQTFMSLPAGSLVIHWEAKQDHLYWGIVEDGPIEKIREEMSDMNQSGYVFSRDLKGGWWKESINGIPLSNIHPKGRDLSINRATINRVQTDPDFFRALILDNDLDEWFSRSDWAEAAEKNNWYPKRIAELRKAKRAALVTPLVVEIADEFEADIIRMATTAIQTVAYANGQTVLQKVKAKDTDMSREELEEEIGLLMKEQKQRCNLTDYKFKSDQLNKHLMPSLDRIDSSKGYVRGNLQIVTRAANFYKSASDAEDWKAKADAMYRMALAMQKQRKLAGRK